MKLRIIYLYLAVVCLGGHPLSLQAQNFSYLKHYTTNDGLPHDVGYNLMQDSKGFLWICTDDGLARFNGTDFKTYRSRDGLLSNYPIDIAEAKDGTLWIGSWKGGTNYLRNDSIYTANIDVPAFRVSHIEINRDKLVLSNEENLTLMYKRKGGQWRLLNHPKKVSLVLRKDTSLTYINIETFDPTKHLKQLLFTKTYLTNQRKMLLYGGLSGVWQYQNDSTFTPFYPQIIQKDTIYQVQQDAQKNYWLGGRGKIIKIDPQGQFQVINQNFPPDDIYDIQYGIDGTIYFLTSFRDLNKRGIYSYNPKTQQVTNLKKQYNLPSLPIHITVDKEGNVWFTTSGDGLYCIVNAPFQNYAQKQGLTNTQITSIIQDGANNMYVGTINGLFQLERQNFKPIKLSDQQASPQILSMYPTKQGKVISFLKYKYLNIGGGIEIYNGQMTPFKPWGFFYQQYSDNKNRIWNVNDYILNLLDTTSSPNKPIYKQHIFSKDLLIQQIFEYQSKYWMATSKGIFAIRENLHRKKGFVDIIDSITVQQGLTSNFVNAVALDPDNGLWIGTKEGLCWLKDGKIKQFTAQDGLVSDNCTHLLVDHRGHLWVGTPKGLSYYNGERFTNYNQETGLSSPNISYLYLDRQKKLWIGTSKGLSALDIAHTPNLTLPPQLYLEKISIQDRQIRDTNDLVLDYYDGMEVRFQALTFMYPEGIRYQYRLDGGPWRQTRLNFISYNRFTAGEHSLEIRARKFNSSWSKVQLIRFEVKLPLWRRTWAIIGYLVVLILLMNWIIKRRSQKLEKEKLHLEKIVAQRTHQLEQQKEEITLQAEKLKEVDQIKSRFFSNISHEFKTPLTLIIGPAEKILTGPKDKSTKTYAQYILANAQRLMKLINQLMDISRMESGKMVVRTEQGDLVAFLGQILQSFELLARQKAIQIEIQTTQEALICDFDRDKIEKIFFNLLSNALKFTPEKGKVILQIEHQLHKTVITVSDTGTGIPAEQIPYIFNRFYQVDDSKTRAYEGTGIGLSLVKELIDLHEGTIEVKSQPKLGTQFKVTLPFASSTSQRTTAPVPIPVLQQDVASGFSKQPSRTLNTSQNTILVVEDNTELREFIVNELSTFYHILEAKDGAEGIDLALKNSPDLVISDLMMPKIDGFELLDTLRNDTTTSHIPIIILTAKASFENRIVGLEKGGDDYLTKPFSPKELLLRVKNRLERRDRMRDMIGRSITQPNTSLKPSPEIKRRRNS